MPENNTTPLKFLDYAIFTFIVIFLLSISNSIFVNQLGYFGALILILIRAALTRQNQFAATGLEFALLWYISAEVLSTLFSSEISASFNNLLKRVLLIPVIYTIIAAAANLKDARKIFIIYIGGTLITVLIYLYFSVRHLYEGLYSVHESGPAVFQYPITASEIISFTVIFLFAFLVNEKTTLKNKIFLFTGFAISLLALFSTYKRTGWMGAAFGILVILVMKKQWKIISAVILLAVIFILTQKNISEVRIFDVDNSSINLRTIIETGGKAYSSFSSDGELIVSAYDEGLLVYKDSLLTDKVELPYAATGYFKWKDDYFLVSLADTRFILIKKESKNLKQIGELYSPGFTVANAVSNGYFYVLDKDSGLTVFADPDDLQRRFRYPSMLSGTKLFVDSSYLIMAGADSGYTVFRLKDGLPHSPAIYRDNKPLGFIGSAAPYLFCEYEDGLKIFMIDPAGISLRADIRRTVSAAGMAYNGEEKFFLYSRDGDIYIIDRTEGNNFVLAGKSEIGFVPTSVSADGNKLYLTRNENPQSRLLGIFDPYHPSNFTRIALWEAGLKIFKDHPVFGVGDIDLAQYYKQYKKPYHKEIQGHLHNNFFHVMATLGSFGLLAVLFLFFRIITIDVKIFKALKDLPFASSYALGSLAAFCGFLISGLTELNFWDHEITTLIWFTFGLNVAFFRSVKPDKKI